MSGVERARRKTWGLLLTTTSPTVQILGSPLQTSLRDIVA